MNLRKRALVGSPSTEVTDREIENRKLVREAAAEACTGQVQLRQLRVELAPVM